MRNPRHVRFEHDHQVGVGEQRARLEAEMHRMARRQADRARIMRHGRNGAALGKMRQRRHGVGGSVAAMISGRSAAAIHSASVAMAARIGVRSGRRRPRLHRSDRLGEIGATAARAAAPDRPARADAPSPLPPSARDHVADLVGIAQFVVPLHQLAHHAGLVEHFLRPVDRTRARAERTLLGDRRAAGGEDQRHAVARKIGEIVDGIGGADIDVHHHRLRMAGHQVGAVRHADREIFVRHQHRLRHLGVGFFGAAEGFDDRRKIGARIAEKIIDAVIGERAQEGLGGDRRPLAPARCQGHVFRPCDAGLLDLARPFSRRRFGLFTRGGNG